MGMLQSFAAKVAFFFWEQIPASHALENDLSNFQSNRRRIWKWVPILAISNMTKLQGWR